MAQNAKPAAQKPADPTVPAKSNKKLLLGVIGALVLVIAGGAGWFFTRSHEAPHAGEVKVAPPKTPIFVKLEPFTVNLKREESDQYLQLGLTFKVFEIENETKIKTSLPEIRSKILQLLTTKTATELLTAEGKNRLIKDIMSMSNAVIGISHAPVFKVVQAAPVAVAAPPSAHGAEGGADAHQGATTEHGTEAASAPVAPPAPVMVQVPVEKTGIVDVLFDSFIIQ